ncbi:MAG: type I-E CRISPR-associated protein Cas5/CasD [Gammaproteobacteria bacterium]|nr:type I-E CRISPR-associated protein Cas5/CasD [Gammaproteobacteria bacterium]
MRALMLTLKGPLRSWGGMSLGDDRDTLDVPTASALIGFLGACAGIDRDDTDALDKWYGAWEAMTLTALEYRYKPPERSYSVQRNPRLRIDYQTAENSLTMGGKTKRNPRDKKISTVVSHRGYLEEGVDVAALKIRENAMDAAELFERAVRGLRYPVFTPCLGRRSNPLAEPPLAPDEAPLSVDTAAELANIMLSRLKKALPEHCTLTKSLLIAPGDWRLKWGDKFPDFSKSLPDQRNGANLTYAQRPCDWFYWSRPQPKE